MGYARGTPGSAECRPHAGHVTYNKVGWRGKSSDPTLTCEVSHLRRSPKRGLAARLLDHMGQFVPAQTNPVAIIGRVAPGGKNDVGFVWQIKRN